MPKTRPRPDGGARRRWVPGLVAVALAVLVALIALVLPHVHRVSQQARDAASASAGKVALPTEYQDAVIAGATEAANLLSYARKSFAADWDRALAGSTGALRKDQEAKRATALAAITKNKIDLTAKVQHSAFESAADNGVLVLVTVNGFVVNDQGQTGVATPQRFELTMVKVDGKWLASDLTSIGIQ